MNQLARELNALLEGTIIGRVLSEYGLRSFFPKGIVAQSAEASAKANRFNATVGMAYSGGSPILANTVSKQIPGFSARESVAYSPTAGNARLREKWESEIRRKNSGLAGASMSKPVLTSGLTNGIFQLGELFVDPDDRIIMPDMFWGNYRLMLETRREARIVTFPFFDDRGSFNTAAFRAVCEKHRSAGKLMVLLNFPNNPAGYAPTVDEADAIVAALHDLAEEGLDIIVVTDDAYFGLYYRNDVYGESLFSRCASLHERVLACKVDGATKEEYLWGLRLGFLTIAAKGLTAVHYDAFEKKLTGSIRASVSNGNTLGQSILLRMLEDPAWQKEKEQIYEDMRSRFETVQGILASYEGPLVALPCNAGYFMSFDCGELDAERIRVYLLERGIGTIAIQNRYLRVAFASVDAGDLPSLYKEIFDAAHAISEEQTQ